MFVDTNQEALEASEMSGSHLSFCSPGPESTGVSPKEETVFPHHQSHSLKVKGHLIFL